MYHTQIQNPNHISHGFMGGLSANQTNLINYWWPYSFNLVGITSEKLHNPVGKEISDGQGRKEGKGFLCWDFLLGRRELGDSLFPSLIEGFIRLFTCAPTLIPSFRSSFSLSMILYGGGAFKASLCTWKADYFSSFFLFPNLCKECW
jgi:hypothetical protein